MMWNWVTISCCLNHVGFLCIPSRFLDEDSLINAHIFLLLKFLKFQNFFQQIEIIISEKSNELHEYKH